MPVAAATGTGRLDVAGALLSATGTIPALVFGFVRVAERGWRDAVAVSALGLAVLTLAALVTTQRRVSAPLLPPRVFADRARAGAFGGARAACGSCVTGFLFFLTLLLQRVFDLDLLRTGLGFLPFGLALMLASGTDGARHCCGGCGRSRSRCAGCCSSAWRC